MMRIPPGVVVAVALIATPATAADSPVRMNAEAGIGNVVRGGTWTPVEVDLENPGPAFNGRVVVHYADQGTKATAQEPVELPTGAKKHVVVYVRPRGGPQRIDVTLEDTRGVARSGPTELTLQAIEDRTVVVALVSMGSHSDPGLRPLISADTRVVALDADQLPEAWPALTTFDAIVLRDPDTAKLGPARIAALKTWVSAGGTLAVVTAEKWRAMDEPSFTELLPVRVKGVRTAHASDLPYPFSEQPGDIAVAVAELLRGRTLVTALDGSPFISVGPYGLGRVAFMCADTGDLPGVSPETKAGIWEGLLDLPPSMPDDPNQMGGGYPGQSPEAFISQELSRIPPLRPPSVFLVTMLIGLYVLVVGPGDYFLLKRMGKLHWTWATYPAAIAVFSAMIYGYARLSRSSDMMVRTLALVDVPAEPPTAPSPMRIFGGVYSPRAGRYQVGVKVPGAVSGGFAEESPYGMGGSGSNEYLASGGKHPSLTLSIPIWSMAGVDIAAATNDPAPFLAEREAGGAIQVTNTGSETLVYVGLLVEGKVVDGGPLEPGGVVKLSRLNAGKKLSELPAEMSQSMFGEEHSKEDLSRIVRVFAYATDPPTGGDTDPYYLPRQKRRRGKLERPRAEKGQPMVFAVARSSALPIDVEGEPAAGAGLTIWRRPIGIRGAFGGETK